MLSGLEQKDNIKLLSELFGRVIRIKKNNKVINYYYKGSLHDIKYLKLSNACYFLPYHKDYKKILQGLKYYKCDLDINENILYTASEHHKANNKGKRVVNLD